MYSLSGYGAMVADRVRVKAYTLALRKTVRPGSVVLEIGAGPAIFAVLCCQLGACRVYAIETSEIIQVGREVAAANGCADRIVFIEEMSTRTNLPEKVDVVVSDLHGVLPLFEQHIPSIADARKRLLAPGGVLIPRRENLWSAVVEAPTAYDGVVDAWEHNVLGLDLSPARRLAVNNRQKVHATPEQLLTKPLLWATLDYATVESADVQGTLAWRVERPGTGHGILVWFETDLADGVGFTNAPGAPETIFGSMFYPWTQPVPLLPGQTVTVDLRAKLTQDDYVWRWTTRIESAGDPGAVIARFDQSQLAGAVLSLANIRKAASSHVAQLSEDGLIDRRILELMDGRVRLEEIARKLALEFPQRFARWQDALTAVGGLAVKYSL